MKDYFNKREQLSILQLQYAEEAFNVLLCHPLIRGADRVKLRESKQALHEGLAGIAEHVPDAEARKLSRLLKTHRIGFDTPDKFRRETTQITIDDRDDLLGVCSERICGGCKKSAKESEACPIARVMQDAQIEPVSDYNPLYCEYNYCDYDEAVLAEGKSYRCKTADLDVNKFLLRLACGQKPKKITKKKQIQDAYKNGKTAEEIAESLGVTRKYVVACRPGEKRKLEPVDKELAIDLIKSGLSLKQASLALGRSQDCLSDLKRRNPAFREALEATEAWQNSPTNKQNIPSEDDILSLIGDGNTGVETSRMLGRYDGFVANYKRKHPDFRAKARNAAGFSGVCPHLNRAPEPGDCLQCTAEGCIYD